MGSHHFSRPFLLVKIIWLQGRDQLWLPQAVKKFIKRILGSSLRIERKAGEPGPGKNRK